MKIRSTIRTLTLAGAAAAMLPGVASAVTAPAFGGWTQDGAGNISGCPAGATCSVLVSEANFLQDQVETTGGKFIRTVVAVPGGDFTIENFVQQSAAASGASGISGLMHVADTGMTSDTTMNTGDFVGTGDELTIVETITDNNGTATNTNDDFSTTVTVGRDISAAGAILGSSTRVDQAVGLDLSGLQADPDRTEFVNARVSGNKSTSAGSATLPVGSGTSTSGGGTVSWSAGNEVVVTWVGQQILLDTLGVQYAGYQAVQNLTVPALADTFDFGGAAAAGPWDWGAGSGLDALFGTAPTL